MLNVSEIILTIDPDAGCCVILIHKIAIVPLVTPSVICLVAEDPLGCVGETVSLRIVIPLCICGGCQPGLVSMEQAVFLVLSATFSRSTLSDSAPLDSRSN
jgi:hypothetical protein